MSVATKLVHVGVNSRHEGRGGSVRRAVYSHKKTRPTVASKKRRSGERAGTFELVTSRRLRRQRMKETRKKKGVHTLGAPAHCAQCSGTLACDPTALINALERHEMLRAMPSRCQAAALQLVNA